MCYWAILSTSADVQVYNSANFQTTMCPGDIDACPAVAKFAYSHSKNDMF